MSLFPTGTYLETYQLKSTHLSSIDTWLAAASFEERCLGAARAFRDRQGKAKRAVILDYSGPRQDKSLAAPNTHSTALHEILGASSHTRVEHTALPLHSARPFIDLLKQVIDSAEGIVVFDITCMTRVHVFVLANFIARFKFQSLIVYTLPDNYAVTSELRDEFRGYERTVVVPLSETAKLREESRARGLVILGHEGHRLTVALDEIEPPGGTLVLPHTDFRPDFSKKAVRRNRHCLYRLQHIGGWRRCRVPFDDADRMAAVVRAEIRHAKRNGGPLLLYPLGPKSLTFASGLVASLDYPQGTWFVYPIPFQYDPDVTQGIYKSYWLPLLMK